MSNNRISRNIKVTGFDVFNGFEDVNPSWAAVSLLPDKIEFNDEQFIVQKHKVPVTYCAVDAKVDELWADRPVVSIQTADYLHTFGSNLKMSIETNMF